MGYVSVFFLGGGDRGLGRRGGLENDGFGFGGVVWGGVCICVFLGGRGSGVGAAGRVGERRKPVREDLRFTRP